MACGCQEGLARDAAEIGGEFVLLLSACSLPRLSALWAAVAF